MDCSDVSPPDEHTYRHLLMTVTPTRAGPDGLSYTAWRNGGEDAIDTLMIMQDAAMGGICPAM